MTLNDRSDIVQPMGLDELRRHINGEVEAKQVEAEKRRLRLEQERLAKVYHAAAAEKMKDLDFPITRIMREAGGIIRKTNSDVVLFLRADWLELNWQFYDVSRERNDTLVPLSWNSVYCYPTLTQEGEIAGYSIRGRWEYQVGMEQPKIAQTLSRAIINPDSSEESVGWQDPRYDKKRLRIPLLESSS